MLEIRAAEPLDDRRLRLTLTDGSVVERDIADYIAGHGYWARLVSDDEYFRRVRVRYGTLLWPGGVDMAPEMLIWGGPDPAAGDDRRPPPFLRVQSPSRGSPRP
jgi:hypothetical protein